MNYLLIELNRAGRIGSQVQDHFAALCLLLAVHQLPLIRVINASRSPPRLLCALLSDLPSILIVWDGALMGLIKGGYLRVITQHPTI